MTDALERTEAVQALLVKAADGELSDEEQDALEELVASDPTLRTELDEMHLVKNNLSGFGLRDPNPDDWDHFEQSLVPRGERLTGWFLLLAAYLALVVVGLFYLFTDPEAPIVIKASVGAAALGVTILFIHVGRRFRRERRRDPYRDIIR